MKKETVSFISFLVLFTLIGYVGASDGSPVSGPSAADQVLGSPLLILVALLIIDVIAFGYRKLRK